MEQVDDLRTAITFFAWPRVMVGTVGTDHLGTGGRLKKWRGRCGGDMF